MKTTNSPSRIVSVATAIEKTQLRRTSIAKEVATINAKLDRLEAEETQLAAKQQEFSRQMDKLTVGSSLAV